MGAYACYGNAQLKVGDDLSQNFQIGDEVPIPDGVYVDYGTVVIIKEGKFLAEFDSLTTKWGDTIDLRIILAPYSPMEQAIKELNEGT